MLNKNTTTTATPTSDHEHHHHQLALSLVGGGLGGTWLLSSWCVANVVVLVVGMASLGFLVFSALNILTVRNLISK